MADLSVAQVLGGDAAVAADLAVLRNWVRAEEGKPLTVELRHKDGLHCDLHSHLTEYMSATDQERVTTDFLDTAIRVELDGSAIRTLSTDAHVLHVCVHASR